MKLFRGIPNLVKFWQKYLALYMKTEVYFIRATDIKSPQQLSVRVKWYQTAKKVQTLRERATLLRYMFVAYLVCLLKLICVFTDKMFWQICTESQVALYTFHDNNSYDDLIASRTM